MKAPRHLHLVVVRHNIQYLLVTSTRGLIFLSGSPVRLNDLSYSQWEWCPDTRRLVTSWWMFLWESLISLKIKNQDCVSNSSIEAEYRSMSTTCSKILCLCGLLVKIEFYQSHPSPLHVDNTRPIQTSTNQIFETTKHIEVDCH